MIIINRTSIIDVCYNYGDRDLWNNPIVCNCSAAWLHSPAMRLSSLSADDAPPTDRCSDDSAEERTRYIDGVDFSHCGMPLSPCISVPTERVRGFSLLRKYRLRGFIIS